MEKVVKQLQTKLSEIDSGPVDVAQVNEAIQKMYDDAAERNKAIDKKIKNLKEKLNAVINLSQ